VSTNPAAASPTWTPTSVDPGQRLTAVGCKPNSVCVAVDYAGNEVTGRVKTKTSTAHGPRIKASPRRRTRTRGASIRITGSVSPGAPRARVNLTPRPRLRRDPGGTTMQEANDGLRAMKTQQNS
jgi:hypothetical protein